MSGRWVLQARTAGVVMSEAEVKSAVEIARRHNLLIVSDEIYEPFLYGNGPKTALPTPAAIYENTIVLRVVVTLLVTMTGPPLARWNVAYCSR